MTTYVEARDALVTAINTAWTAAYPSTKLFYENTTQLDLDTVGTAFLTVAIDFTDSARLDIDPVPNSQTWGEVTFRIFSKDGTGTRGGLQFMDFLTVFMKYKVFGGVTTYCPSPGVKQAEKGWASQDLNVPFFFYQ